MALLSLYFRKCASDFDDSCTDVRDSCPEWFASVLCARKFSFAPQGVDPKLLPFHFYWFPGLVRKGTYKFTLVHSCVRACVPVLQPWPFDIFFDFLHEVVSSYDLDDHKKKFGWKNFWPPKLPKMVKTWPFLAKIAIFEVFWLYLPNAAINFHNFWYGNYPCGLLWENHSVYAGKILRWPKFGHLWPKLIVLKVFGL